MNEIVLHGRMGKRQRAVDVKVTEKKIAFNTLILVGAHFVSRSLTYTTENVEHWVSKLPTYLVFATLC